VQSHQYKVLLTLSTSFLLSFPNNTRNLTSFQKIKAPSWCVLLCRDTKTYPPPFHGWLDIVNKKMERHGYVLPSVWVPTCSKAETYLCMESGDTISHFLCQNVKLWILPKKTVYRLHARSRDQLGMYKVIASVLCPALSSANPTGITFIQRPMRTMQV
jgi:hypothetical protein